MAVDGIKAPATTYLISDHEMYRISKRTLFPVANNVHARLPPGANFWLRATFLIALLPPHCSA